MSGSITAANATLQITVGTLFPIPVTLVQWDADDVFDVPEIEVVESKMGVDGVAAYGFIYQLVDWDINFHPFSPSCAIFDTIFTTEQQQGEKILLQGAIVLPGITTQFVLSNGVLAKYKPAPGAGKTLKPRKFTMRWESIFPQPVSFI